MAHFVTNIEESDLSDSWIVLQSKKYETVHFLSMKIAVDSQISVEDQLSERAQRSLGGNFIKAKQDSVRIKTSPKDDNDLEFWSQTNAMITSDGK